MPKNRILVTPLNWGLGHATRCIPIINQLILQNFEPVLASDGAALELLRKEFPELEYYTLPEYNIRYSKRKHFFKLKLLVQTPKILTAIRKEKKTVANLVKTHNISGIISDNRWGVRHKKIPSVFITHQLTVLSGSFTLYSSKIQQHLISKFTECWIPDFKNAPNLSGEMGHLTKPLLKIKYIGPLSRFTQFHLPLKYKYAIILSGPEPQREILETLLLKEFKNYKSPILLIRGVLEKQVKFEIVGNIKVYNYLLGKELEDAINSSEAVICRSGYTSVMDLAAMQKKAFFIPTPGQPEQEYLAKILSEINLVGSCIQHEFTLEKLEILKKTKGLNFNNSRYTEKLDFSLFNGE